MIDKLMIVYLLGLAIVLFILDFFSCREYNK